MIQAVETGRNISFYKPVRPSPGPVDRLQGRVASSRGTEAVAPVGKSWLIVGFQDGPDRLLEHLIRPGGKTERALLLGRAFLLDVDALGWLPPIPFISNGIDDGLNLVQAHPVGSFRRHTGRHRTLVFG